MRRYGSKRPGGRVSATITVTRTVNGEEEEVKAEVSGRRAPFYPATNWDPAEGGEIEDVEATIDGQRVDLTEAEHNLAEEALAEEEAD